MTVSFTTEQLYSMSLSEARANYAKMDSRSKTVIEQRFPEITNFVSHDHTTYEITDDKADAANSRGYDAVKDSSQSGLSSGSEVGRTVAHAAGEVANVGAQIGSMYTMSTAMDTYTKAKEAVKTVKAAKEAVDTANKAADLAEKTAKACDTADNCARAQEAASTAQDAQDALDKAKKGGKNVGSPYDPVALATTGVAVADALIYAATKPGEEQYNDLLEAQNTIIPAVNETLTEETLNLDETAEEAEEKAEESRAAQEYAEELNEEANEKMLENQDEFSQESDIYEDLLARQAAGEKLTDDEKDTLKSLRPSMEDKVETNTGIQEETTEAVGEAYEIIGDLGEEIAGLQENLDTSAESIEETVGATDAIASFDQDSADAAGEQATIQTLFSQVASTGTSSNGMKAATDIATAMSLSSTLFGAGAATPYWVGAAVHGATAVTSTVTQKEIEKDVAEQNMYQQSDLQAVEMRVEAQQNIAATQEVYDNTLQTYAESVSMNENNTAAVEELEMEVPTEMELPEEDDGGTAESRGAAANDDDKAAIIIGLQAEDEDEKKK